MIMKYVSIVYLIAFFILITIVGYKDSIKQEEPVIEQSNFTESMDNGIWRVNFKVVEKY